MRLSRPLLAAAILIAVTAAPNGAGAAKAPSTQTTIDARLRQLRQLVGEASAQETALLNQLEDARDRRQQLDAAVRRLDGQIGDATVRLRASEVELERLEGGFRDLDRRIADTQAQMANAKQSLAETVSALYRQADRANAAIYTAVILKAKTPHDIFAANRYLAQAAGERRVDVSRLTALRDLTQQLRDQLDEQRTDARVARDVVAAERSRLDGLRNEQAAARADALAEEQHEKALLDSARARKAEFERELVALQAQSNSLARLLRSRQINQALQPSGRGVLKVPVGAPVVSGFGPRLHPIFGEVRVHAGIDFAAGFGTPIRAAGPGVVVIAGPYGGYGNAVVIDHGNGLATLYAHQSALSVRPGQSVKTGQVVGLVGATGFATGPHLHFEVRVKGTPANPLAYL